MEGMGAFIQTSMSINDNGVNPGAAAWETAERLGQVWARVPSDVPYGEGWVLVFCGLDGPDLVLCDAIRVNGQSGGVGYSRVEYHPVKQEDLPCVTV